MTDIRVQFDVDDLFGVRIFVDKHFKQSKSCCSCHN